MTACKNRAKGTNKLTIDAFEDIIGGIKPVTVSQERKREGSWRIALSVPDRPFVESVE